MPSAARCSRRSSPRTLRSQGYVFNIELTYRALLAGFRVAEVPITFRDRQAGQSKISLDIAFEALLLVPRLREPGPHPAPRDIRPPATDEVRQAGESTPA